MCFCNFSRKYHIADKPITCFKLMKRVGADSDGILLNSTMYPKRKPYHIGDEIVDSLGFYACNKVAADKVNGLDCFYGEVVHSYCIPGVSLYTEEQDVVLVRCEIPAGEPYWEECSEFASFRVVIKEVYDFKWRASFENGFGACRETRYPPTLDLFEVRDTFLCLWEDGKTILSDEIMAYKWYTIEKIPFGIYN